MDGTVPRPCEVGGGWHFEKCMLDVLLKGPAWVRDESILGLDERPVLG